MAKITKEEALAKFLSLKEEAANQLEAFKASGETKKRLYINLHSFNDGDATFGGHTFIIIAPHLASAACEEIESKVIDRWEKRAQKMVYDYAACLFS